MHSLYFRLSQFFSNKNALNVSFQYVFFHIYNFELNFLCSSKLFEYCVFYFIPNQKAMGNINLKNKV